MSSIISQASRFPHYIERVPVENKLTEEEEEKYLTLLEHIGHKVSTEELVPFVKLIEEEHPSAEIIAQAKTNLQTIFDKCIDEEKDALMTLMFNLAEGKEALLFQVMEDLPNALSYLTPQLPLISAFDQPKGNLRQMRLYLSHLGFEPLTQEIAKQKNLFDQLTPSLQTQIATNIHDFLDEFEKYITPANAEKLTPLDLVHLNFLAQHIMGLYGNRSEFQSQTEVILKKIIECQTKILENQSPKKRLLFARTIQDWSLMDQLRRHTFPQIYQQLHQSAAKTVDDVTIGKSWYSTQEQLLYLIDRARQVKREDPGKGEVMNKIISRSERKLADLKAGKSVKMPAYYHMTKEKVLPLILKSAIEVREATEGSGAYVSTRLETDYGTFGLVLDRQDVESGELTKISTVNRTKFWPVSGQPSWRALAKDIPIMLKEGKTLRLNLVYLVADPTVGIEGTKQLLTQWNLKDVVEVVSFDEARYEEQFLKELRGTFEPKHWSSFWLETEATKMYDLFNKGIAKFQFKTKHKEEEESQAWE